MELEISHFQSSTSFLSIKYQTAILMDPKFNHTPNKYINSHTHIYIYIYIFSFCIQFVTLYKNLGKLLNYMLQKKNILRVKL